MKIESYKQGTPSWVDLSTTDVDVAKRFYSTLFGWEYQDNPMGDGQVYSMARIGGLAAGAMYQQVSEEAEMELPSHWKIYIAVDDVDAIAARVPEFGGSVMMAPFDVFTAGRMCIVQDPTGGTIHFWQANGQIGAEVRDEHGAITWAELLTQDQARAGEFYSELLGVTVGDSGMPTPEGEPYHLISVEGEPKGGIMTMPANLVEMRVPPHWEVYFAVDDAAAAVDAAKSMGGEVMFGPEDMGDIGVIAVLQDPQGAVFGINQPATV